jgi:hypothetical protein
MKCYPEGSFSREMYYYCVARRQVIAGPFTSRDNAELAATTYRRAQVVREDDVPHHMLITYYRRLARGVIHPPRDCHRCERLADLDRILASYRCPGGHQERCGCERPPGGCMTRHEFRESRERLGLTQAELAARLGVTGTSI